MNHNKKASPSLYIQCLTISSSRIRGPGASPDCGGSGGEGFAPRAAAGAQEPVGPGAELCFLTAL